MKIPVCLYIGTNVISSLTNTLFAVKIGVYTGYSQHHSLIRSAFFPNRLLAWCIISMGMVFPLFAKAQMQEVTRFAKFEKTIDTADILDPTIKYLATRRIYNDTADQTVYNKDSIYLEATFHSSDGNIKTLNGFYFEEWMFIDADPDTQWKYLACQRLQRNTMACWKVRFTPEVEGLYQYHFRFVAPGRNITLNVDSGSFLCIPALNEKNGFIRMENKEYFVHSDRTTFNSLGINTYSYPQWRITAPVANYYDTLFARISQNGGNTARIGIDFYGGIALVGWRTLPYANQPYPESGYHLRDLSQADAFCLDTIVALAEKHNIRLHIRFFYGDSFDDINTFKVDSVTNDTTSIWRNYNAFNINRKMPFPHPDTIDKGMCNNINDFFANAEAIKIQNDLYRYLIDRWGYSPNISVWEIMAECDKPGMNYSLLAPWHATKVQLIKDYDIYNRAVTTSFTTHMVDNHLVADFMNVLNYLDYIHIHRYLGNWVDTFQSLSHAGLLFEVCKDFRAKNYFGNQKKAVLITESANYHGIDDTTYRPNPQICSYERWDSMALGFHQTLWSSLMFGTVGPYFDWITDSFIDKDHPGVPASHHMKQFHGISKYMQLMPALGKFDHVPIRIDTTSSIWGYMLKTPENQALYGYIYDKNFYLNRFIRLALDSMSIKNDYTPWRSKHLYLGDFNPAHKPARASASNLFAIHDSLLNAGKHKIRWVDTETGEVVATDFADIQTGNHLTLKIPEVLAGSNYGDAALIIEPTEAGWDNEPLANPSEPLVNGSRILYSKGKLFYINGTHGKPGWIRNLTQDSWTDSIINQQAAQTFFHGFDINPVTEDLYYPNYQGQLCMLTKGSNGSYTYAMVDSTNYLVNSTDEIHHGSSGRLYFANAQEQGKMSMIYPSGGQWQPPVTLNSSAPAAAGSRGFVVKQGSSDTLFYFDADGYVIHIYQDGQGNWQYNSTVQDANAKGRTFSEILCGKGNDLFFIREAGDICVLTRYNNGWDIWLVNENAPKVLSGTGFAVDTVNGYALWYAGTDRNIYKLYDDGTRWVWQQFNIQNSASEGVKDSSDIVVANEQVFYVAKSDGKIHRLRQVYEVPFTVSGSTANQYNAWDLPGVDGNERVYKFYLPETRSIDATTCDTATNYNTKIAIYKGDGTSTGYSNDTYECMYAGSFSTLKNMLLTEGHYFAVVDGALGATGDFKLMVEDPCQGLKNMDGIGLINSETWAGNSRVCGGLEIPSGVTLTVKCTVRFQEHAKIQIQPGGKLILDGGTLTAVDCADSWEGIQVLGDPELQQLPANQGVLEIVHGGTISRAKYAIQAPGRIFAESVSYEDLGGGILKLDSARIINNQNGIWIGRYENKRTVSGVTKIMDNVSYIRNCRFENNQQYSMDKIPGCHIGLHGVKRVKIEGNTFENSISSLYWNNGNGIESFDAELWVTERCASQQTPCPATVPKTFKGLNYGIRVWGSTPGNPVTIRGNLFDNVYRSIYANGCTRTIIHQNTIKVPNQLFNYNPPISTAKTSQNDKAPYGIYLDYCTGFEVQENTLSTPASYGLNDSTHALIINNSGPNSNEIYKNTIHDFRYALAPQNQNRSNDPFVGLKLKCNEMDTNYRDVFVSSDPTLPIKGVCFYQGAESGSNSFGAGNTFTAASANDRQFCNAGMDPVIYYYFDGQQNQIPYYSSNITSNKGKYWDSTSQCLSKIPTNFVALNSKYSELAVAQAELNSSVLIRNIYINGGQQNLEQTVKLTLPWEAYEMYNELMLESPYLSEEVLIAAIENSVFSDLMIKLICIANPQCTRMPEVMEALYNRYPPMPETYMEQIMDGGETVSQLEVLEGNVSESMHQVEQIINQIKRIYEIDSANAWSEDSLMSLLSWHHNLFSKYELAIKYLYNGDTELMDDLLDALPDEFGMEDPEWAAHLDYVEYLELLDLLREEERLPIELTGEEVEGLLTLAANDRSYTAAWARTMLKLSDAGYLYQEPILIDQEYSPRKGRIRSSKANVLQALKVYPNPAQTYVNVDISDFAIANNDFLKVADLKGNEVWLANLVQCQQGCVIEVKNWKPGIYVFSYWHNGKSMATTRVAIQ